MYLIILIIVELLAYTIVNSECMHALYKHLECYFQLLFTTKLLLLRITAKHTHQIKHLFNRETYYTNFYRRRRAASTPLRFLLTLIKKKSSNPTVNYVFKNKHYTQYIYIIKYIIYYTIYIIYI